MAEGSRSLESVQALQQAPDLASPLPGGTRAAAVQPTTQQHPPPKPVPTTIPDHGRPTTFYNHFLSTVASTDLRPDLVVRGDTQQALVLAELTVGFETNFVDASLKKRDKYQYLLETCTAKSYTTNLILLEVGSRGSINIRGFEQHFPFSKGGKLNQGSGHGNHLTFASNMDSTQQTSEC